MLFGEEYIRLEDNNTFPKMLRSARSLIAGRVKDKPNLQPAIMRSFSRGRKRKREVVPPDGRLAQS